MHQALYRKYRPRTFDEVCGQHQITDVLRYEVENGRYSHAYLFCGSRGTGKTTCAKILAKALNCLEPRGGNPCLECEVCREIDAGIATDVTELDAATNNSVDQIRTICEEAAYTPASLKKKVYIIDEVHMLSQGAFNALLKTIEEPPEHVVFILATTEFNKIPATIVSRCQRFDFRRISVKDLASRLEYIAGCENIALEEDAALLLARQAQGGMRDAIGLFELCAADGGDVTAEKVSEILGLSGYERAADTFAAVHAGDMAKLFAVVSDVAHGSGDIAVFWQELISFARDMLVSKYTDDVSAYLDITSSETELLRGCAAGFSLAELIFDCKVLDDTLVRMQRAPQNKRCAAELALLRMCRPELDPSNEALSLRVSKLEDALSLGTLTAPQSGATSASGGTQTSTSAENSYANAENKTPVPDTKAEETGTPTVTAAVDIPRAAAPAAADGNLKQTEDPTADPSKQYTPVRDISEVLARLDGVNRGLSEFLAGAETSVSGDGKHVKIAASGFGAVMLSSVGAKEALANAFALAKITDGIADIEVIEIKSAGHGASPSDELLKLL